MLQTIREDGDLTTNFFLKREDMARDLIDPMNPDTFDDRIIMHGPIRSQLPNDAYRRGWDKAFGRKIRINISRRKLWLKVSIRELFSIVNTMSSTKEPKQC
jgi:hypothetical protein